MLEASIEKQESIFCLIYAYEKKPELLEAIKRFSRIL